MAQKVTILHILSINLLIMILSICFLHNNNSTQAVVYNNIQPIQLSHTLINPIEQPIQSTIEPLADRGMNIEQPQEIEDKIVLDMRATAYDLSVASCGKSRNNPEYGITRTGTRATVGRTVAVDPNTIPLGSHLEIIFSEPYEYLSGKYVAEDTGNAVKGDIIDIFLGEDKPGSHKIAKIVDNFGHQHVKVYILKE